MDKPIQNKFSGDTPVAGSEWQQKPVVGVAFAKGISFANVSYSEDSKQILDDITLDVEPGKILCLLGPSGSGKTSLLRIAAGLIENCSGTVSIDGAVVTGPSGFVPPEKRGVGLVFQDYALFPHLTLLQNMEFGLAEFGRKEAREQAVRVLSRVGLEGRADNYPHILSGGEQQRVALARALAPRPGILLMDEPFSGLDSRMRDSIREQSLELLRETRSTAVIVTHDAEEALRVGDYIALIKDGKLVQHGTGRDLYYNPKNLFAAGFFSEINKFTAPLIDGSAQTVFGPINASDIMGHQCDVAVRHSDVNVTPYKPAKAGRVGRIISRRFLGTSELLDIAVDSLETSLQARIRPGQIGRNDTEVLVSVDPDLMMIFETTGN
ncbi:MAG: ABC transporter ATP-binding protein [Pseudomonadota bacterium]